MIPFYAKVCQGAGVINGAAVWKAENPDKQGGEGKIKRNCETHSYLKNDKKETNA